MLDLDATLEQLRALEAQVDQLGAQMRSETTPWHLEAQLRRTQTTLLERRLEFVRLLFQVYHLVMGDSWLEDPIKWGNTELVGLTYDHGMVTEIRVGGGFASKNYTIEEIAKKPAYFAKLTKLLLGRLQGVHTVPEGLRQEGETLQILWAQLKEQVANLDQVFAPVLV